MDFLVIACYVLLHIWQYLLQIQKQRIKQEAGYFGYVEDVLMSNDFYIPEYGDDRELQMQQFDTEIVCIYCGEPKGDKISCCGENHFEERSIEE